LGFPATLAEWIFPIRPAPRTATLNISETPVDLEVNRIPSPTAHGCADARVLVM
jgi:hypothetical protein